MQKQDAGHGALITGGFLALVIAMGVGRFADTLLLQAMQNQFGFSDEIAGLIASVNYLGYLLGALLCFKNMRVETTLRVFRISLLLSVVTTAWMGFVTQAVPWTIFRLASGMASAGIFIIGSSIVMSSLCIYPGISPIIKTPAFGSSIDCRPFHAGPGDFTPCFIFPLAVCHFRSDFVWGNIHGHHRFHPFHRQNT